MKSKTPTLGGASDPSSGGAPAPPARHQTPLGIPQQGQPERKGTPPPFKAQTPPPFKAQTPSPFKAQTPSPFKAQTPPAHAFDAQKFESEPPTKQKNMTASIYQSLLSVFDEMTDEQRMEFVDLASVFASLTAGARKDLVDVLQDYAKLGPEDRRAVLETVTSLEKTRRR